MWDKELEKYTGAYWAFIVLHLIRNLLMAVAYFWNVIKSEIYNAFLVKIIPYGVALIILFVLQNWRDIDDRYFVFLLIFNISGMLMILASMLRTNHTSEHSFLWGIIASLLFIISDFLATRSIGDWGEAFRTLLLILASYTVTISTFDHVSHYKLTVKNRVYLQMNDEIGTKLQPQPMV